MTDRRQSRCRAGVGVAAAGGPPRRVCDVAALVSPRISPSGPPMCLVSYFGADTATASSGPRGRKKLRARQLLNSRLRSGSERRMLLCAVGHAPVRGAFPR